MSEGGEPEIEEPAYSPPSQAEFERDIATLSANELRRKYRKEAGSHRNAKRRSADKGISFAPEWQDFRPFLRDVGPAPTRDHSLDRIDFNNPHYGPGLVRWATKLEQTENRSSTVWVHLDGERMTVRQFCKRTGIPDKTVYSALARGLSGEEIAKGRAVGSAWRHPTPEDEETFWETFQQWKNKVHPDYKAFAHAEIYYVIRTQRRVGEIGARITDYGGDLFNEGTLDEWRGRHRKANEELEAARIFVMNKHPKIAGWFKAQGPDWRKRIIDLEKGVQRGRPG